MKYNFLGKTGVLVSEICLGTMGFSGKGFWEVVGRQGQDEANELLKTAIDSGVNFVDTANAYSFGESEVLLGNAVRQLGISRQQIVIATKARLRMGNGVNQVGLSRLHLMDAVNDSLQRLQTEHIDLYYIHGVDVHTPLEETLRGLEDIVRSGKVRYLGISNHSAWQIMKALGISERHGWTRFEALQHFYSIATRDCEREVLPLAQEQQLGFMPWSPLAGGFLSGKFTRQIEKAGGSRRDDFDFPPLNKDKAYDIIEAMQPIAATHGVSVAQVALAWLLANQQVTSVIVGAKRKEQLTDNLAAVNLKLTGEELKTLDAVSALSPEYPAWMIDWQNNDRMPSQ